LAEPEPAAGGAGAPARAWIEIDLGALARNFRALAALVAPARVLPVLKADAYGHGAAEVAKTLAALGAAGFAVARPAEGVALRRAGVTARILVFAPAATPELGALARFDLSPVVSDLDQLDELERFAAATGWRPRVHLKIDTGMHRLGVPLARAGEAIARLRAARALVWEGLLSHLAAADDPSSPMTGEQLARFRSVVATLTGAERARLELHLANGAGALLEPETRFDLVRPGLALFGGAPPGAPIALEPVLSLRAQLLQTKSVAAGGRVGYGGRWTAPRPSRIGIVGVGYADGYPWRAGAGGGAAALVRGRRVALVGAVSMDLVALDLTEVGGEVGEEVVLVGRQGGETIRIEELARAAGTLPYELLCSFRLRLPRRVTGGAPAEAAALAGERGG
jgi:alanine racemase